MPSIIRHTADWRAIASLDGYRLLVAFGLVAILLMGIDRSLFEPVAPSAFRLACLIYLVQCVLAMGAALLRWPRPLRHVVLTVAVDIVFFNALMLTGTGAAGGLGELLIPPLAAAGILLPARLASFMAACSVLALLAQEAWRPLQWPAAQSAFVQAGILGALYFLVVGIAYMLARRAQRSEALAEDRASEARNLAEINRRIIRKMQMGAIVVDAQRSIQLMNGSAIDLLALADSPAPGQPLDSVAPQLATTLAQWQESSSASAPIVHTSGRTLLPTFSVFDEEPGSTILIFLEDAQRQNERIHQLKLVSIGRLTASIAHEIRNPLSAISHAGQLMIESPDIQAADKRLLEIVQRQAARIESIVKSVLSLSRRPERNRERIALADCLRARVAEYTQSDREAPAFYTDAVEDTLWIDFDPDHLRQILFNLWDNAKRHAPRPGHPLALHLATGRRHNGHPVLTVTDNGPGIDPEVADHVLEPFYTTTHDGTGLGLYITRELCEANGAQLTPVVHTEGACFRITFARPAIP